VFQSLLFAGYAYAHLTATRLRPRVQYAVHLTVVSAAAALLPVLPGAAWRPSAGESPLMSILLIVLACVGLPFFALSTTGPLLQAWFHRAARGSSPYRLYALSNAGSLLALVSYPFLIEPALPLATQSVIWSALFVLFAILVATCGGSALRGAHATAVSEQATDHQLTPPVARGRLALWFVLGFLPSAMLLAATNQICLDVASVPFLWVLPLSLYLLSFILTFDSRRWYSRRVFLIAFLVSAGGMAYVLNGGAAASVPFQATVFLCGLFATAMLCHGELARLKPDPAQLTTFYLVLAAAGAAGGVFVAVLAPLMFDSFLELHLTIVGTLLLMLFLFRRDPAWRLAPATRRWIGRAAVAAALVIASALSYSVIQERQDDVDRTRDFYGVLRIMRTELAGPDDAVVKLVHGRIIHGAQFTHASRRNRPTLYYGRRSGVGLALQHHAAAQPRRVGVVGLGAGTLAVYGRAEDHFCFYEINPEVARLAREHFTYLRDCSRRCAAGPAGRIGARRAAPVRRPGAGRLFERRHPHAPADARGGAAVLGAPAAGRDPGGPPFEPAL
jgi:hypothetical protein